MNTTLELVNWYFLQHVVVVLVKLAQEYWFIVTGAALVKNHDDMILVIMCHGPFVFLIHQIYTRDETASSSESPIALYHPRRPPNIIHTFCIDFWKKCLKLVKVELLVFLTFRHDGLVQSDLTLVAIKPSAMMPHGMTANGCFVITFAKVTTNGNHRGALGGAGVHARVCL